MFILLFRCISIIVFSFMKWSISIHPLMSVSRLNSVCHKWCFQSRKKSLIFYNCFVCFYGFGCTGDEILLPNGEINRIALGQLVFNDVEKRRILNFITHPPIHQTIYRQIIKYFLLGHNFIVLDLPLLFETGRFLPYIHKIITVTW